MPDKNHIDMRLRKSFSYRGLSYPLIFFPGSHLSDIFLSHVNVNSSRTGTEEFEIKF